jgi:NitT/TauT family transport system substrate-binding protein
MKRTFLLFLVAVLIVGTFVGCTTKEVSKDGDNAEVAKETEENEVENSSGEIPEISVAWGKDLHTANPHMAFEKPELFENNPVHLRPISDSKLEMVKDGEVIAIVNFVLGGSGSENVTLMSQGHLDVAYSSSTAFMTGIDQGLDCSILCPIQSGGVSIVADVNAEYDTFEELIEYAKNAEKPILAGYHSAVSSPRIVLEYALKEAGLKVAEDTSDFEADVIMIDLKGLNNLIPSLSSGQVELWAGPIPYPQNAEAQGVGKIIATLDELPGGKWVDFPCCTVNVHNDLIKNHPEVVQALIEITTDIHNFAQNEREKTADILAGFVGLDVEILKNNDTTYSTAISENFKNGMRIYYEAMTEMGKFSGEFLGKDFDEVKDRVFDFSFRENISGK